MNKQSAYIRSAFLLTMALLAFVVISTQTNLPRQSSLVSAAGNPDLAGQKEPAAAHKGLNAVNVKLARYGGMQFGGGVMTSLRTTNDKGEFNFGVVPAGSYHLTVSLPTELAGPSNTAAASAKEKHEMKKSIIQNIKAREANPSATDLKECLITVTGGVGGTIKAGWDFETAKAFDPSPNSTAKTGGNLNRSRENIDVISDGRNALSGTVVRSRSNVRNN